MSTPWKRKEVIGDATLYLGDCLEILPHVGEVDAVVTDPPYVGLKGGGEHVRGGVAGHLVQGSTPVGDPWGASHRWVELALPRFAALAFCGHADIVSLNAAFDRPGWLLTWFKRNAPAARKGVVRFCAEYVWAVRFGGACSWHLLDTVLDVPNANAGCAGGGERIVNHDGKAAHPTQKPVRLMERLLLPEFGSVLDPFMGSGTTGVACANLGRKFIGIELDPKYFDIACERIAAAYAQGRLFE